MTINFYNNTSPKKKIGKSLTLVSSLTGSLREECDMINPSVLIESAGVIKGNYVHIPEFGRYYYVTKVTSVREKLWRVDMHVDVRESFGDSIKRNKAVIERAQGYYNLYLKDNMLPVENDTFTVTQTIGDKTFGISNVVLTVQS